MLTRTWLLWRSSWPFALAVFAMLALTAAACDSGDASTRGGVTVEPLASPTRAIPIGGKPAAPQSPRAPTPTAAVEAQPTEEPVAVSTSAPEPSNTAAPPEGPPTTGRWIDVDVTKFVVRMMDGQNVVGELAPVGVGVQIDTGEYLSTQTGLFHVHTMIEGLAYDAPFDTYISHWIGFDPEKDNGFHSFLKDATGAVVDASTGRVSNGCIRVGDAATLFAFAEIGMPVYVHA